MLFGDSAISQVSFRNSDQFTHCYFLQKQLRETHHQCLDDSFHSFSTGTNHCTESMHHIILQKDQGSNIHCEGAHVSSFRYTLPPTHYFFYHTPRNCMELSVRPQPHHLLHSRGSTNWTIVPDLTFCVCRSIIL